MKNNFYKKCYELLKLIPKGKVTTYKEMAKALDSKAYRAVGTAMAKNKTPIKLPCHRVIKSDGKIGGYALGKDKKIALLQKEGVVIENEKIKNLDFVLFTFDTKNVGFYK